MPWKDKGEQKADRRAALRDAAAEARHGNLKDAAGIARAALNNNKTDPDMTVMTVMPADGD